MENTLFNKFDMLEQVPTELMTEITDNPEIKSNLLDAADHTKITIADNIPQDSAWQPNTPGTNQNPANNAANNPQPQKMNVANLITGQMAVNFLDMVLPVVCVILIEKINKRKVNKKFLQATLDEKKIIEPVLHNYLMSINFNVDSPLNALLITVAMIYGTKTIEVINNVPQSFTPPAMPQPFKRQTGNETRGRHKLKCQCDKCKAKRKN